MRSRVRDGLIGAGVAVLVLVVAAALTFWSMSEPAGTAGADGPTSPAPAPTSGTSPAPPTDLGPAELWLDDLVLDAGAVATPDALLRDVTATAHDVRSGPTGLVAGSMSVVATVPFPLVADQVGAGVTVSAAGGDKATIERTLTLLGREVDVVATGTVAVKDGQLVVEPTSIDVGGPSFLAGALAGLARRFVTLEYPIQGLPEGLVLQQVDVQDDGFRATLAGDDVRIAFPGS